MGLFDSILGGGSTDFAGDSQAAFQREMERLRDKSKLERERAKFLTTEGEGISEQTNVTFGADLDLELLSEEEQEQRSSGRITRDTGLIL